MLDALCVDVEPTERLAVIVIKEDGVVLVHESGGPVVSDGRSEIARYDAGIDAGHANAGVLPA